MARSRSVMAFTHMALAWISALPLSAQNDECCIVSLLDLLVLEPEITGDAPGGRSTGLAGAFAALADDATASFTNPSGLGGLARPSLAIAPTYASRDSQVSPFFAFAYPWARWTVAFYHVQPASVRGRDPSRLGSGHLAEEAELAHDVTAFGLALAYFPHESVYLGAGLTHFRLDFHGRQLLQEGVTLTQTVDDADYGLHAGIIVKPDRAWNLGAFWRQETRFSLNSRVEGRFPDGRFGDFDLDGASDFRHPSSYGLGFAYRPTWALNLVFQADRLARSKTLATSGPVAVGELLGDYLIDPGGIFENKDETRYRMAVEYSFWGVKWVPALRGGIRLDRDGSIFFRPTRQTSRTEAYLNAYPEPNETWHYALGTGILPREGMSLEVGAVYSENRVSYALLFTKRL